MRYVFILILAMIVLFYFADQSKAEEPGAVIDIPDSLVTKFEEGQIVASNVYRGERVPWAPQLYTGFSDRQDCIDKADYVVASMAEQPETKAAPQKFHDWGSACYVVSGTQMIRFYVKLFQNPAGDA